MWCTHDAMEVDSKDLLNDAQWGWVHHLETSYHTLGGTPLHLEGSKLVFAAPGFPNLPAITINLAR